jgi:hypothetical protein
MRDDDLDSPAGFSEVLTTWDWWDRPRSGVTLIDGNPYRFTCHFDEALDDYPDEYRLWPISAQQLDADLAFWRIWIEWRGQFDSGAHPAPFEEHPDYASLKPGIDQYRGAPPAGALVAVPEWRLDPDRKFAGRVPRHQVRWTFITPNS